MAWDWGPHFEIHGMGWDTAKNLKNALCPIPWDGMGWDRFFRPMPKPGIYSTVASYVYLVVIYYIIFNLIYKCRPAGSNITQYKCISYMILYIAVKI